MTPEAEGKFKKQLKRIRQTQLILAATQIMVIFLIIMSLR
jgi:hypothetical protein